VRSGAEPVSFSASDNSGIQRAEIVDVTDAADPAVVATEDYDTSTGGACVDRPGGYAHATSSEGE
jgi:hypothetical protein